MLFPFFFLSNVLLIHRNILIFGEAKFISLVGHVLVSYL